MESKAEEVNVDVTNNVCEYKGLLLLLNFLMKERWFNKRILVIMDAQLVI